MPFRRLHWTRPRNLWNATRKRLDFAIFGTCLLCRILLLIAFFCFAVVRTSFVALDCAKGAVALELAPVLLHGVVDAVNDASDVQARFRLLLCFRIPEVLTLADVEVSAFANNAGFRIVKREIFNRFRVWFCRFHGFVSWICPHTELYLKNPCKSSKKA